MSLTITEDITVSAALEADTATYNLTVGNSYVEQEDGWYIIEEYGFGTSGEGNPITNGSISPTTFKGYNIQGFCVEQRYFQTVAYKPMRFGWLLQVILNLQLNRLKLS